MQRVQYVLAANNNKSSPASLKKPFVLKHHRAYCIHSFLFLHLAPTKTKEMKKIILFAAIAIFTSCKNDESTTASTKDPKSESSTNTSASYPYPISYSADFEMSDPKRAQQVAELWKDFDNNTLSKQKDAFADSIVMYFSGMRFSGTRDSMMAMTQTYRDRYSKVESKIAAIMSTHAKDKDEDWVAVWGSEILTDKNGKIDSSALHEIWRFNKDGKINYLSQFRQEYPVKK